MSCARPREHDNGFAIAHICKQGPGFRLGQGVAAALYLSLLTLGTAMQLFHLPPVLRMSLCMITSSYLASLVLLTCHNSQTMDRSCLFTKPFHQSIHGLWRCIQHCMVRQGIIVHGSSNLARHRHLQSMIVLNRLSWSRRYCTTM